MKIINWLDNSTDKLSQSDISTSRLDCLVILSDELKKDKAWILANQDHELNKNQLKELDLKIDRRAKHEPLAYIRGKTEFFGREFAVSADTLEPRPETETMIELLLKEKISKNAVITDIGTGSGAIAITVKLELGSCKVFATEINTTALKVAKSNAKILKADVGFFEGDLLKPLLDQAIFADILLCNLPYVPSSWLINDAAKWEPSVAIFGGDDGLDLYRQMFEQIENLAKKPKLIFTESLPPQHDQLRNMTNKLGYSQKLEQDFIQVFISLST